MGSIEDPQYGQSLVRSLHNLYETKCLCDVTLKTADGCELKAHWLILAAHSEYFHSMHGSRNSDSPVNTVDLDVDLDVLQNILDYLYSGKVKVTDSNRAQLLDTGQKLKFEYLVRFISNQTSVMTADGMRESCSPATRVSSLDLPGDRYKSGRDHSVGVWSGGSPGSDLRNQGLPESESVFLPESLPHTDSEEFDINRVKDEVEEEEEDPLSSNLQVTFNTEGFAETSDVAPMPKDQFMSSKNQLRDPDLVDGKAVHISHIVPNIAGGKVPQNILLPSASADAGDGSPSRYDHEEVSLFQCLAASDKLEENKIRRRKTQSDGLNVKNRPGEQRGGCRRTPRAQTCNFAASVHSDIRDNFQKSNKSTSRVKTKKIRKGAVLLRTRTKSAQKGAESVPRRLGIAIVSVDSVGRDVISDVDNEPAEGGSVVDDEFGNKTDDVALVPPLTGCNDQIDEFLIPSPRKKRKSGKTAVKTLKKGRAGNFLIRWNKNSICSLCGFEGQISDVVTHRKSAHPEEAHVCPLCFNKSVDHRAMIQHLKRQHLWRESGKYSCGKCGRDCHNRVGLLSHDQIVHGVHHGEVLVCEAEGCHFYCAAQSPATMGEHRKGHGDTFGYACEHCDKQYKTRKALKNHMYHHINSQRYQCEICGYFTATPSDLKLHTTTNHSDGPLYKCHVCGNNYRSQYSMDDHLWKVHGLKDDKRKCLQCDECDFITLWQGTLTAHKKIHVTEKNFACEICGKIFRTPNNLSSHRNSTHKESDLHCNFCQHTTKTLDHMRKHLMIAHYYKGVKPYSCVYCSYKSMTGGNVRKHVMVQHPAEDVKYVPDRELLAEMKAKWLSLDKSQWTDVLRNK
ncbi:uncharacterized protein [Haliotis cracherodii]|uniref:uncharacterized protein n=1 Tax=Haliotis cracherodii TaxID=6455 RepID=UPI0039E9A75A